MGFEWRNNSNNNNKIEHMFSLAVSHFTCNFEGAPVAPSKCCVSCASLEEIRQASWVELTLQMLTCMFLSVILSKIQTNLVTHLFCVYFTALMLLLLFSTAVIH